MKAWNMWLLEFNTRCNSNTLPIQQENATSEYKSNNCDKRVQEKWERERRTRRQRQRWWWRRQRQWNEGMGWIWKKENREFRDLLTWNDKNHSIKKLTLHLKWKVSEQRSIHAYGRPAINFSLCRFTLEHLRFVPDRGEKKDSLMHV